MTAEKSAQGRSARARGARAEVQVKNYLKENGWPDARRYLAGDGVQPGDIDFHPLVCLEVRDRASSSWPSWCRDAAAEARTGMVPVVVRRTRGMTDVGAWECRVSGAGWMNATDTAPTPVFGPDRCDVDGWWWHPCTFDVFVAALRRFDAIDQAVAS